MFQQALAKLTQHREVEAFVGQFQAEGIFPVNAGAHRIGSLTVREVLGELHDADQCQPPGGISRLTVGRIEVGELVVGEERAQHIAHLHVDIAFAKRAPGDFGGQVRNGRDGSAFAGTSGTGFLS